MTTRWADIDVYGHMNNARYFELIDTVVNNHLDRALGRRHPHAPARRGGGRGRLPLLRRGRLPGPVDLGVAVDPVGSSSIVYRVGIFQGRGDEACAEGTFVHVYVDNTDPARPVVPIPPEIRRRGRCYDCTAST